MADNWSTQMRKGVIELCLLARLQREESYGYQLLTTLATAPALKVTESTLYPILARLTREQFLAVRMEPSPNGPARRYYKLTPLGETRLAELRTQWQVISQAVAHLLEGI